MVDVHNKDTRSYNMSQIKGKNSKPELIVRKYLFSQGLRYRVHVSSLPGKPDIVLRKYNTVIFIHGCFWHRHKNCPYCSTPKSNQQFWQDKFKRTIDNDVKHQKELKKSGWNLIIIWECELNKTSKEKKLVQLFKSIMEQKEHLAC